MTMTTAAVTALSTLVPEPTPGGQWTYQVTDLLMGTVLDELPLARVSMNEQINAPGQLAGRVPLYDLTLFDDRRRRDVIASTVPYRTGLYALRDGVPIWGGVITDADPDGDTLGITAKGFLEWLNHQTITADLDYGPDATFVSGGVRWEGVCQLTIAAALVRAALSAQNAIDILVPTQTCDTVRDREYAFSDKKSIGEALLQLAEVDGGFDVAIDVSRDSQSRIVRTLRLSYPTRGRTRDRSGLVFEQPGNITALSWAAPTGGFATVMHGVGSGDGQDALRTTITNTALHSAGFPKWDRTVTYSDVTRLSTLNEHVRADLAAAGTTMRIPEVTTLGRDPRVDSYGTGDEVLLRVTNPSWPTTITGRPGLVATSRILARKITPPDVAGDETVTHTMTTPELVR